MFPMIFHVDAKASSVYISGDDIYVAGSEVVDKITTARLWKNGLIQSLDLASSQHFLARSVYVK